MTGWVENEAICRIGAFVQPHRSASRLLICTGILFGLSAGSFAADNTAMARPSGHWVYRLPPREQTGRVNVVVLATLRGRTPVQQATVLAHCEPWDWTARATTDHSGKCRFRGPPGDWNLYVSAYRGSGAGVLAAVRRVKISTDTTVRVASRTSTTINLPKRTGSGARPRGVSPDIIVSFAPIDVPSADDSISCGFTGSGTLRMDGTAGLKGWFCATLSAGQGASGYALFSPCIPGSPVNFKPRGPAARLQLKLDGVPGGAARAVVGLESLDRPAPVARVPIGMPRQGGTYTIAVTPGNYRLSVSFRTGDESVAYIGRIISLRRGTTRTVGYGGGFKARANIRRWNARVLDLLFDVMDSKGNYLYHVPVEKASLKVSQGRRVLFDGQVERCRARWIRIERNWAPALSDGPVTFEYTTGSPLIGTVQARGVLSQKDALAEHIPLGSQSKHFDVTCREKGSPNTKRLAGAMDRAYAWLVANYAGAVRPSRGRKRFELRCWTPAGVGIAGGVVGISIYSPHYLVPSLPGGGTRVLFHEFGHTYQAYDPHHQARGMGSAMCESQATMISDYCMMATIGPRAYRWTNNVVSNRFFRFIDGKPDAASDPNRYEFILHYIHDRFGQDANRKFFRAMYASEGNCERILLSADFLKTEHMRAAALYSFLTGENLAWLWRWAKFPVPDGQVDRATAWFKQHGAKPPG